MLASSLFIGRLAGAIAALAFVPYIISILHGHTKPNRATWAIWSMAGIILASSYYAAGARDTIWVTISYAVFYCFVFLLSLKYGVGGYAKFDLACLAGATVGLGLWMSTNDPVVTVYIMSGVNLLGILPTLKKVHKDPDSENKLAWSMDVTAAALNLFAISGIALHIWVYPISSFIGNLAVVLLLYIPKIKASSHNLLSVLPRKSILEEN